LPASMMAGRLRKELSGSTVVRKVHKFTLPKLSVGDRLGPAIREMRQETPGWSQLPRS
jgi:hypothetical protein